MKILEGNMKEVDKNVDKRVQKLFIDILDAAGEECLTENNECKPDFSAMRWYASLLDGTAKDNDLDLESLVTDVLEHRLSSDIPFDKALSQVFSKRADLRDKLSEEEKNLLLWHMKHLECDLNANMRDLSTKYYDASQVHGFNGK